MSLKTLITWIGMADVEASKGERPNELGPVGQAVTVLQFDRIVLLNNFDQGLGSRNVDWIQKQTEGKV